ncbi:MAG: hypothetical protein ACJ795_06185 [Ktedonobacteraceae bacterium]
MPPRSLSWSGEYLPTIDVFLLNAKTMGNSSGPPLVFSTRVDGEQSANHAGTSATDCHPPDSDGKDQHEGQLVARLPNTNAPSCVRPTRASDGFCSLYGKALRLDHSALTSRRI